MITHPPKNSTKYFYNFDNYFEYSIGRVLEYLTEKMLGYGIEFDKYNVDGDGYYQDKLRPHYQIYPYDNNIIYMYSDGKYGYEIDCYKLCFYPNHVLSAEQAKKVTALFCQHDNYQLLNQNRDVMDPQNWVEYLTFQAPISHTKSKNTPGAMNGRIIVQFKLHGIWNIIREERIDTLFNTNETTL